MGTYRDHQNMMKTGFGLLFLSVVLQTGTEAQICTAPALVRIDENNAVDAEVTTITVTGDVDLVITTPEYPFRLDGTKLLATEVLDYESGVTRYAVGIRCTGPGGVTPLTINVALININDNPPVFAQRVYTFDVSELTAVGSVVETVKATDPDEDSLIYSITASSSDVFALQSPLVPGIVLVKPLDFDQIKTVQLTLTVQDEDPAIPSHTDSTTIDITITDADNRPPWFQPCTVTEVQGLKICPNTGYTGVVSLGKLEDGPLALKPNHILAIDGDNGINEPVRYSIISGSDGFFDIGAETGNITLLKAADEEKMFYLTVMASQVVNSYQFATTSLIINVVTESLHEPQFERPLYEAVVQGVGTMAMDAGDKGKVLKIIATDQDYAPAGGINPNIVYTITGTESTAFSIINGYLFMSTEVPGGIYNLQVKAEDTTNFQTATAQLSVEVVPEPTTILPPTTISTPTSEPTTAPTAAPTTAPTAAPSTAAPSTAPTTTPTDPTSNPTTALVTSDPLISTLMTTLGTTGASVQTSNPVPTTEGTTANTAGVIKPTGGFTSAQMAALGASLGCLLFVCIVAIIVLVMKIRKRDTAWKKINEASAFRSSLGPSGQKEGVQFTNEAFQHDDDDKDNKGGPSGGGLQNGTVPSGLETDKPQARSVPRPPSPIQDEEKVVKPIITKDKLKEDGYKAVWFKEDIDPNAKEDVVIIPNSTAEEEEEEDEGEMKIPKVKFNETDGDSGLGDKNEDSEEEVITSSL